MAAHDSWWTAYKYIEYGFSSYYDLPNLKSTFSDIER